MKNKEQIQKVVDKVLEDVQQAIREGVKRSMRGDVVVLGGQSPKVGRERETWKVGYDAGRKDGIQSEVSKSRNKPARQFYGPSIVDQLKPEPLGKDRNGTAVSKGDAIQYLNRLGFATRANGDYVDAESDDGHTGWVARWADVHLVVRNAKPISRAKGERGAVFGDSD